MKITVLDRISIGNDLSFEELRKIGDVEIFDASAKEEVPSRVKDTEILILNKIKVDREVMLSAKRLKLVCVFATGYDNIDIKAARELGIAVTNVPAYSTESVALFTIATALSLYTKLNQYNRFVRSGEYTESGLPNKLTPVYHELKGKTWGILGCGNIGSRVAEIAQAFGARVIVTKRTPSDRFKTVDFDTLCKESDILSLHCPLNEGTRGIVDEKHLSMMKKDVVLVNEARGAVVDESAVADKIKSGALGGYGCDVYSAEPFSREHPFYEIRNLENVILTPHAAWGAYEARERALGIICDNIRDFLSNKNTNRVDI